MVSTEEATVDFSRLIDVSQKPNMNEIIAASDSFMDAVGIFEDGKASERVVDLMNRKRVLVNGE